MANPSDVNAEAGIREKNTVYYEGVNSQSKCNSGSSGCIYFEKKKR